MDVAPWHATLLPWHSSLMLAWACGKAAPTEAAGLANALGELVLKVRYESGCEKVHEAIARCTRQSSAMLLDVDPPFVEAFIGAECSDLSGASVWVRKGGRLWLWVGSKPGAPCMAELVAKQGLQMAAWGPLAPVALLTGRPATDPPTGPARLCPRRSASAQPLRRGEPSAGAASSRERSAAPRGRREIEFLCRLKCGRTVKKDSHDYVKEGQMVFCPACTIKRAESQVSRPCAAPGCSASVVYSGFEMQVMGTSPPEFCPLCQKGKAA